MQDLCIHIHLAPVEVRTLFEPKALVVIRQLAVLGRGY